MTFRPKYITFDCYGTLTRMRMGDMAREMYADVWLGFNEAEVEGFLREAEFQRVQTSVVHREQESPHFETLLAVGEKA